MLKTINCTVNGRAMELQVDVRESLLDMLRNRLHLTGTKQGCGVGECGACAVLIDGETLDSCIYLAVWADGKDIVSIEGLTGADGSLSDLQQNFVDKGAVQCGFCTPGFVVSATALLEKNPNPSKDEIRRGLSGNLCRCTGYQKILDAVESTADQRRNK
ncbi:MAG: carbon-monoxide dehydrogenase small subunit [Fusobacteria bacterium]|nr:MAG: carbon-monoxide dehydrogenase small subunit [Fusobacteriota bacterium]KAF0229329.1 MAG: carbon-monoxide dehydrogenase small [Fusobacteriota bacterium]